jgi:hypothetical protein
VVAGESSKECCFLHSTYGSTATFNMMPVSSAGETLPA